MDWPGAFPEAYGFEKGACNVLVFSPEGVLVHQAAAKRIDNAKRREIVQHVTALVAPD
jgi:hypothetical protein